MSSLASATSGGIIPTQTACLPNVFNNTPDYSGLTGRVCAINIPPDVANVTSCCSDGAEVRVENNCTQYCETGDSNFLRCVQDKIENSPPDLFAQCRNVNEESDDEDEMTTVVSGTTIVSTDSAGSVQTTVSGGTTVIVTESGTGASGTGNGPEETGAPEGGDGEGAAAGNSGRFSLVLATAAVVMTFGFIGFL